MGKKRGRPVGMRLSDETKRKIAEGKTGYQHTQETKDKISESLIEFYRQQSSWGTELKHVYQDNPEVLQWVLDHIDDLDGTEECTTERRLNRDRIKNIPVGHKIEFTPDTVNPEILYLLKEEICGE